MKYSQTCIQQRKYDRVRQVTTFLRLEDLACQFWFLVSHALLLLEGNYLVVTL